MLVWNEHSVSIRNGGRRGRDHMVVGFKTTYAISPITNKVVSSNPVHSKVYLTLCDKACQWLAAGLWFSPGTLVSSINKTDNHDITEILLKVALNTINLNQTIRNALSRNTYTALEPNNSSTLKQGNISLISTINSILLKTVITVTT